MTVLADASARAAISRERLDRTLFVEAGAGTGKTTQLVSRIASLVCDNAVLMIEIAAITFTEAAAAELRTRVREVLEHRRVGEHDEVVVARIDAALDDLDIAAISTLHAFAQRLVSAHATSVGVPPRIAVLDEVESQLGFEQRWQRFLDELFGRADLDELLVRALLLGVPIDERYRSGLRQLALAFNENWDRLAGFVNVDRGLAEIDWASLTPHLEALRDVSSTCRDEDDTLYVRITEVCVPFIERVVSESAETDRLRALHAFSVWKTGRVGRAANWDDIDDARKTVSRASEAVDAVRASAIDGVLADLAVHLAAFTERAARERASNGTLEFHDLLVLARQLLRDDPAARASIHRRFTHLLLDEFQDTDPIQVEIAVAIAAGDSFDTDWRGSETPDGSLFFVGDPKQSIYRFRRADISLFLEARDRFAGDGVIRLVQNFRTVPPVLDFVNSVFSDLMDHELVGRQPAYTPLRATREVQSGADHRPVVFGGPHDVSLRAGDLRTREAVDVASIVATMLNDPSRWPVFDARSGRWRPMRARDVAVLVPTRTSLSVLTAALERADVDYRSETGSLVFATDEVREVLILLQAADDPSDEIAVVGALRSSILAVSDTDLAHWKQRGGSFDYRVVSRSGGAVAEGLEYLDRLHEARWWVTPSALVDRLYRDRGLLALAHATSRPDERLRNLRTLLDRARGFVDAGGGDLREFLAWARLQAADGARVHEPVVDDVDVDAVRILTMHGSKGLEYPIVVLSGLTTLQGRRRSGVRVFYGDEHHEPEVSLSRSLETADFDRRRDLEDEMDQHEALRLLYVAATRARDHLVVSGHHREGKESHGATMYRQAVREPTLVRHWERDDTTSFTAPDSPTTVPAIEEGVVARAKWSDEHAALLARAAEPAVVPATALARHRRGPARRGDGAAIGRAVHTVMEQVDFADTSRLPAIVEAAVRAERIGDEAARVEDTVRAALDTATIDLARRCRHHREMFVAAPAERRVVEGYVDLVIEAAEGIVVVDYKTDDVDDPTVLIDVYAPQLGAYAHCLTHEAGLTVAEARILWCRPGAATELRVEVDDAIEAARSALRRSRASANPAAAVTIVDGRHQ